MANNANSSEAFEALKQYLVENHNAKVASGGREIVKRCHICGDSRDPTSAHMYIGMHNGAIVYNCFKCNAKGIVDGKFLRDMDCYDTNIALLCQEQNKSASGSNSSHSGGFRRALAKSLVIPLSDNEFAIKKLHYLNNRLGVNFGQSELAKYKVILNLKDFLLFNNITRFTRNDELMDLLDKFFIGFLSMDNRYVIMRRLVPEGKLPKFIDARYINYNIFGNNDGMKFYTIPNSIDALKPISIHITEGIFDIISVCNNVNKGVLGNNIYASVNGKTYLSLVQFFITTFGISDFDLHIYPDADISDNEMHRIKRELSVFFIRIFVHRNTFPGEKDYGVSPDRVIDTCIKI